MLRLVQIVSFLFSVLYALFATRFVLEYVEARSVPFVTMIDRATDVFLRPFHGIVANGHDQAGHPIAWWIAIGFVAYVVLHAIVVGLLQMINRAPVED